MTPPQVRWYVIIRRGQHLQGLLAGPFNSQAEAEAYVPAVQLAAPKVDPASHFDLFGVLAVTSKTGWFGPGKMNARLGLPAELSPDPAA